MVPSASARLSTSWRLHDVAGDREQERHAVAAIDGQGDGAALRTADPVARGVDGQPVDRGAVDEGHDVAGLQPDPFGRRARQRLGHDEPAGRAERRAALRAVERLGRDLGADALELPADALQALAIVVRRQVGRIRVLEGADHPPDGALDQGVRVDAAARVPVGDRVVGVPERLEGGSLRGRRAGVGAGLSAEGVAGHEQRRPAEQDDQHHGDRDERSAALRGWRAKVGAGTAVEVPAASSFDRSGTAGSGSAGSMIRVLQVRRPRNGAQRTTGDDERLWAVQRMR